MTPVRVVAVDLGASSGRVFAADIAADHLTLAEIARFPNEPVRVGETLRWDIRGLYRGMLAGLRAAGRDRAIASVGIDSWAVDYGLLRADGTMIADPVCYRDGRTASVYAELVEKLGAAELYRRTGIALQRFNTLYQLACDARCGHLDAAAKMLLIPDLLAHFLTGAVAAEQTNASTTQLLGVDGTWDADLLAVAGIPPALVAPIVPPGTGLGDIRHEVAADLGMSTPVPVPVTATASHDTAAAVVAVPTVGPDFAFISCGTWSLVGLELDEPVRTEAARLASFTNERGINGTTRFLRNVMGLWLLQESIRTWERAGEDVELTALIAGAADSEPLRAVIEPDLPEFLAPGDMPARIAAACREHGQPVPGTPASLTRCILDSLAVAYRRALRDARALTGRHIDVLHVVGGGVRNRLLCQLVADACALPVVAGPVEAAALGNALVQARALGVASADRWELRWFVADQIELDHFQPRPPMTTRYAEAAAALDARCT
ncbi:MAG: rhamnulokinase [Mycobacteriales bacterium]